MYYYYVYIYKDRISGFERQVREVERKERDAVRKLNERDALYNDLKSEAKICSETAEQSAETIQQLEQDLALTKQRYGTTAGSGILPFTFDSRYNVLQGTSRDLRPP